MLTRLLNLLSTLLPRLPSQSERDEAYFAESVDIHDLERRMREVDARGRRAGADLSFNLGLR